MRENGELSLSQARSELHSSKGNYYFMLPRSQPESPKALLNELTPSGQSSPSSALQGGYAR